MRYAALGALFCGIAVLLGAFGAHGLRDSISAASLDIFQTGVHYQMVHGLALLALAALEGRLACPHRARFTALFFGIGVVIFSGSLYGLALSNVKALGMITPVGGLLMILGWALFVWNAAGAPKPKSDHAGPGPGITSIP